MRRRRVKVHGDGRRSGQCSWSALEVSADSDASIAAAWALGCVARHGKETAAPLAKCGAIKALMDCYASVEARDTSRRELAKAVLSGLVKNCGSLRLLDPLVAPETPGVILRHVLAEFADKLRGDVELRRAFVTSGGLMRLQAVLKANDARAAKAAKAREGAPLLPPRAETDDQENDDELEPILDARAVRDAKKINANFPADVVSYYLYC